VVEEGADCEPCDGGFDLIAEVTVRAPRENRVGRFQALAAGRKATKTNQDQD
jgi:hypothetical protein